MSENPYASFNKSWSHVFRSSALYSHHHPVDGRGRTCEWKQRDRSANFFALTQSAAFADVYMLIYLHILSPFHQVLCERTGVTTLLASCWWRWREALASSRPISFLARRCCWASAAFVALYDHFVDVWNLQSRKKWIQEWSCDSLLLSLRILSQSACAMVSAWGKLDAKVLRDRGMYFFLRPTFHVMQSRLVRFWSVSRIFRLGVLWFFGMTGYVGRILKRCR